MRENGGSCFCYDDAGDIESETGRQTGRGGKKDRQKWRQTDEKNVRHYNEERENETWRDRKGERNARR